MVEIFKSPINIQNAQVASVRATSEQVTIGANSSVRVTLTFARPFENAPVILYSVICADNAFCLAHYIAEVTTTGMVICVENQAMIDRVIKIAYEARAN